MITTDALSDREYTEHLAEMTIRDLATQLTGELMRTVNALSNIDTDPIEFGFIVKDLQEISEEYENTLHCWALEGIAACQSACPCA